MIYVFSKRATGGNNNSGVVTPRNLATNQSATSPNVSNNQTTNSTYKDGTYTGDTVDAYYGNVQVQAIISGKKITDIQFLNYPQDRQHSADINAQAMPYLKTEAIQAQSANVDIISGATLTSQAFQQSLQSALNQAK